MPARPVARLASCAPSFPRVCCPRFGAGPVGAAGPSMSTWSRTSAAPQQVADRAAACRRKVLLENGGNHPLLVDRDMDPAWAAEQAALGAFTNSGQVCTAVERIYVHEPIAASSRRLVRPPAAAPTAAPPLVDTRRPGQGPRPVSAALGAGAPPLKGGEVPDGPVPATGDRAGRLHTGHAGADRGDVRPGCPGAGGGRVRRGPRPGGSGGYGLAATVLSSRWATPTRRGGPAGGNGEGQCRVRRRAGRRRPAPRSSGAGFGYGPELLDEFTTIKVVHIGVPNGRC